MLGLGDGIVFVMAISALAYGIYIVISRKPPLYFQLNLAALSCYVLGYLFDVCEFFVSGILSGGFLIGYLGTIGCFLFLLTMNFAYMDGILDDKTPMMKNARWLALFAPLLLMALLIPNLLSDAPKETKIVYFVVWVVGSLSAYFNLKHILIPDMGFGFVKAIKPFNIAALSFTFFEFIHLTLWNFCDWIPLLFSGALLGVSCLAMVITADRGIKRWTI